MKDIRDFCSATAFLEIVPDGKQRLVLEVLPFAAKPLAALFCKLRGARFAGGRRPGVSGSEIYVVEKSDASGDPRLRW